MPEERSISCSRMPSPVTLALDNQTMSTDDNSAINALHNAVSQNRRQLHYLNRLLRLARQPSPDANTALKVILKSAVKALGAHRCAYWIVHSTPAQTRSLLVYDDIKQNFVTEPEDPLLLHALHPLLRQTAGTGKVLTADDVDLEPRTALACEYFHALSIKSAIMVPIRHGGDTDGVLLLSHLHQARAWRRDEAELISHAAELAAQAFHKGEFAHIASRHRADNQHDVLTGLPNRRFLLEHAEELFPRVIAGASALALFLIDIDGFRRINENYGHAVGDQLLKTIALRLKNVVRKDDTLLRVGGDRFLLLARKLGDMRIADDIGQEIVETLQGAYSLQAREVEVSASVGVALYPLDGNDLDTLQKHAEIALAHAKSGGRNGYRMYSPRLAHRVEGKSVLEGDLRRAIRESELQHFYQPQVDLRTGKTRCVEALLRWRHPRHGTLLPAAFLPLAEEYGLMQHVSAWVLRDVCAQLRIWNERGLDRFCIAINLSTTQMADHGLLPMLEEVIERSGIAGSQLELEISESTAMRRDAMSASLLSRIAEMQIGLSIDDFGTGYSNMTYLRRYPVHKVKIDRSLVDGLPGASDERAVTDAIISMALPLGLDVVAEGVETQQQLDYLRARGCGIAQGYYFSEPLTADQFETWLTRH